MAGEIAWDQSSIPRAMLKRKQNQGMELCTCNHSARDEENGGYLGSLDSHCNSVRDVLRRMVDVT